MSADLDTDVDQRTDDARVWLHEMLTDTHGEVGEVRLALARGEEWDELRGFRADRSPFDELVADHAGMLDALASSAVMAADSGHDVFATPYLYAGRRRRGGAVGRRHVHADIDGPLDLARVRYVGGMAVASGSLAEDGSPRGHVYARLARSVTAVEHQALCLALGQFVGREHHDTGKVNDNDVLRPAGTLNQKTDPPRPVSWLIRPDDASVRTWEPEVLAHLLGVGRPAPDSGDDAASRGAAALVLPKVIENGRRGDTLFRYACSLQARGVREDEALVLLRDAYTRCRPAYIERSPEAMWSHVVAEYGATTVTTARTATVPDLPADIEACSTHRDHLEFGCPSCIVVRAQVERYARARAMAREGLAMASTDAWIPVDLTLAPDLPPRTMLWADPCEPGGEGMALLRPGLVSGLHGVTGSGKTRLAHIGTTQEVEAGNLVLIVDYEMRQVQTKLSLLECGLSPAQIRDGVVYVEDPPAVSDFYFDRLMEELLARMDATGRPFTLGVFDSVSRSMGKVPGWTTNDEIHVNAWYDSLPRRLLREFPTYTPFTIDHPGRADGPDAIGSHAKGAGPDFRLHCIRETKFSKANGGSGRAVVRVVKNRVPDLPLDTDIAELVVVGPDMLFRRLPEPKPGEAALALDRMSPRDAAEVEVLERLTEACSDGLMTKEACGEGGFYADRRAALDRLKTKALVVSRRAGRGGRGERWWAIECLPLEFDEGL
jgi:hypothetical protein